MLINEKQIDKPFVNFLESHTKIKMHVDVFFYFKFENFVCIHAPTINFIAGVLRNVRKCIYVTDVINYKEEETLFKDDFSLYYCYNKEITFI